MPPEALCDDDLAVDSDSIVATGPNGWGLPIQAHTRQFVSPDSLLQ